MTAGRLILPIAEPILNADGVPQVGALLTVYENNTTTPASIYTDEGLGTPLANPQTSDEAGRFYDQSTEIWADGSVAYSVKLEWPDTDGTVYTFDDIWLVGETLQSIPFASDAQAIAGTSTTLVINPANLAAVLATLPEPAVIPVGSLIQMAGSTPPIGYLPCDGAAVSRTTYSALWTYAQASGMMAADATDHTNNPGKWYTGNGSTTFNVPNLGGVFLRSWTATQTIDSGRAVGTTQTDDYKAHYHLSGDASNLSSERYSGTATSTSVLASQYGNAGSSTRAFNSSTMPATGGTETRPVNISLPWFVKT